MDVIQGKRIIRQNICGFHRCLSEMAIRSPQSKASKMKAVILEICKRKVSDWNEGLYEHLYREQIEEQLFESSQTYFFNLELFKQRMDRLKRFLMTYAFEVIRVQPIIQFTKENQIIEVQADLFLMNHQLGLLVHLETGESPFNVKPSGHLLKDPGFSMELFLLELAAQQLSQNSGKPISGALMYLKSKKDKVDSFEKDFILDKNDNLILSQVLYRPQLEERLVHLLKNMGDETPCSGSYCLTCRYHSLCHYEEVKPQVLKKKEVFEKTNSPVKWTQEQLKFIEFELGICRSNAVAGAGKTTVIANRFIRLIQKGYSPKGFLLITFTEKGVKELKEKISYWLEKNQLDVGLAEEMTITTFNGFGNELIKRYYHKLGLTQSPKLLTRIEKISIIKEICDESDMIQGLRYDYPFLNHRYAKGVYFQLADYFDLLKHLETIGIKEIQQLHECSQLSFEIIQLYQHYKARCLERNLIDYEDQIFYACQLVKEQEIVEFLRYTHLVIDEMQDTNAEQLYLIERLTTSSHFLSLVACGDDSQSIYSFRGADQRVILNLHQTFQNLSDLPLSNNFRSTVEILELANKLNDHNLSKIDKRIVGHRHGKKPQIVKTKETFYEVIQAHLKAGVRPSEIAVISFNRSQLLKIKEELNRLNLPNNFVVTELLKDNVQVQRVISLVKFLKNRQSEFELCEFIQFAYYQDYLQASNKAKWLEGMVQRFKEKIEGLSAYQLLGLLLNTIKQLSVQYPSCQKLNEALMEKRFNRLDQVLDFIEKIELYDSDLSITPSDDLEGIVLTTAHASKGREFKVVFCLTDTFEAPTQELLKKDPQAYQLQLEEKRRVLFVAITRAKDFLYLVNVNKSTYFSSEIEGLVSSF